MLRRDREVDLVRLNHQAEQVQVDGPERAVEDGARAIGSRDRNLDDLVGEGPDGIAKGVSDATRQGAVRKQCPAMTSEAGDVQRAD